MSVGIKPVEEDVIPILEQISFHNPDKHTKRIERQKKGEAIYLIAWKGGVPVGHAFVKWNPPLPEEFAKIVKDFADIEDLFVLPEYRSQGIGSQLIQAAAEVARKKGFKLLGLAVDPERNPRAHALYLRHGFSDVGLPPFDTSGRWTDTEGNVHPYEEWSVYMTKKLA